MSPSNEALPRVLLIGCGPTALAALDSLVPRFKVVGIMRTHDCPTPHGDPVRRRAQELGVPVTEDTSLQRIEQLIAQLRPCCVVVSSYDRIIPPHVLAGARFVNVHYAPLPRYRGRASVNWAILNGETSTAISIHALVPDLDGGNILFQQHIAIGDDDTVWTVYERLNAILRVQLGSVVTHFLAGEAGEPQDHADATYGCTRVPRDGEIDWSQSTRKIHHLIRSLSVPYPGAFTYLKTDPLRVWDAAPVKNPLRYEGRIPGRVVQVARRGGWVDVLTGDGVLRIAEVEPLDGPRQPAAEVITSVKWTLGLQLFDLLQRVRVLETALAELCQQYGRQLPVAAD